MFRGAQSSMLFWTSMVTIVAMLVPILAAAALEDWLIARTFMYYALFSAILLYIYGVALGGNSAERTSGAALLEAASVYIAVPIIAAAPVVDLYPNLGWRIVIFDMISAFTTTGTSRLANIGPVSDVIHLWRAMMAWLGGYYFLLIAFSVLGPLRINGCDAREDGSYTLTESYYAAAYDASRRTILRRFNKTVLPAYVTTTLVLFLGILISGEDVTPAIVLSMSTLSTSGIVLVEHAPGFVAEVLIAVFLCLALSRFILASQGAKRLREGFVGNPEIRIAFGLVFIVTIFLFSRHYAGAINQDSVDDFGTAISALWGSFFTSLSFLTTSGFVSEYWAGAQEWSDLETSELILMALAICGGGVATTAGGVKLLRVYTLTQHGLRELNKLSSPSSVPRSDGVRGMRRRSVMNSWVVVMLFGFSIGLFTLIFTLTGHQFEDALLLTVAGLSTTGPLLTEAASGRDLVTPLSNFELTVLEVAMIAGRLEALAVLALFNPILWQNRIGREKRNFA
ncbi:MAG: potassium transporter TrkG [Pseudomonadota bacterium]